MPRPPSGASGGRLGEQVEDARQQSGAMPMPVSRTRTTASSPPGSASSSIRPPGSVYLAALFSRLTTTCSSRTGSASSADRPGRSVTAARGLRSSIRGRTASTAGGRPRRGRRLAAELDLAPADPRDVQQVVDQPCQVADLAIDDLLAQSRGSSAPGLPQRAATALRIGRQRIAQLVGQHGQELVLAAVGLLAARASASRRSVTSRKTSTMPSNSPPVAPDRGGRCRRSAARCRRGRSGACGWPGRPPRPPPAPAPPGSRPRRGSAR